MAGNGPGGDRGHGGALAEVWARSKGIMRERVAVLDEAARAMLDGRLTAEQRRLAERAADKLAGSLGSFGLAEGSRLAGEVRRLMRSTERPGGDEAYRLSDLVVALGQELAAGPAPSGPADDDSGALPSVLVVDADREFAYRLVEQALALRLYPSAVPSAAAARPHLAAARPDLVLLDPANAGEPDGGQGFLAELCLTADPVTTLVVTPPGGAVDRAEAARLGSRGYLEKPVPPRKVVEVANRLLHRRRREPAVLVVGDPATSAVVRDALRPRGWRVDGVDDAGQFWTSLHLRQPDLLVLDVDSPPQEAPRLCRMVRGDPAWDQLPVVVLAGGDGRAQTELLQAGADDVVVKPIAVGDLIVHLTNQLSRGQYRLVDADPRTEPERWQQWELDLRRLLTRAARYGQPVAVAVLGVDPRQPPDRRAATAGALGRLLCQSLRLEDPVGRRGEQHVAVALYGVSQAGAVERMAGVLAAYRAGPGADADAAATASAGLAMYPADGDRADALVEAAGTALQAAQAGGGDQVRVATDDAQASAAPRAVDVLLVDDDEALAPLVLHALTAHGYRTHWLRDGSDAAALLLGPDGVRAQVVLLDADLPGLDGLSVLRKMADVGLLERCRVVLLTLRSTTQEALEVLELGAFDHVAKPVGIPLLVRRVRRAIESL